VYKALCDPEGIRVLLLMKDPSNVLYARGAMADQPSFEPRNILCPLDFSELSDLALKYAFVAARAYRAKVSILHAEVFELPKYFVPSESNRLVGELAKAREAAREDLNNHVREVIGPRQGEILYSFDIVESHPVDAILKTAETKKVDLIVLGTHGYGGFKRLMLGSVAENVIRHATIPVFAVRQKAHAFIDTTLSDVLPHLKHILCPVNMTPASGKALRHALSLSARFQSRLTVLFCLESGDTSSRSRNGERVAEWLREEAGQGRDLEPIVREGHAAEQIIAYAREVKVDLIVLAVNHRPFLDGTFFGRTTELVLRHGPVPVLGTPFFSVAEGSHGSE
jgi:nucleotide-binding universal stress UspA family protein